MKHKNSELFHQACLSLRGELGIAVLSLFLPLDSAVIKAVIDGNLPICYAANSCLNVLKLLQKAYPESISIPPSTEATSLHRIIVFDKAIDIAEKVKYLCDQCPALIYVKDKLGCTALHHAPSNEIFNFECIKSICDIDERVAREACTPMTPTTFSGSHPLHVLIKFKHQILEVSDQGDCFRLLLRLSSRSWYLYQK
jgi:hypothetical protein